MATLEELQTRRAAYLAAELKILQSQEYQVGQGQNARRNVRAELAEVRTAIKELNDDIAKATPGVRRSFNVVPRCR